MPPSRGKALVESLPKPPPSQRAARSSDPFEGAFFAPGAAGQQARQLVRKVCMLRQAAKWVTLRHRFPRRRLCPLLQCRLQGANGGEIAANFGPISNFGVLAPRRSALRR